MDDTRRPRLAARALWLCALLALIAASVLGVALPAEEAAAQALGGRGFRDTSIGGGQVQLNWNTGTGQTGYRVNRITSAGTVAVANLPATATTFTDSLGTLITVACYQLEILGANNAVVGRSDILCNIVNLAGGTAPVRNIGITTNESPIVTVSWQAPAAGGQIGYLVVPLGRSPLPFLPANATTAVDAPGEPTCYIVLALGPDSAQVPFKIIGFSDIKCAVPGVFSPQPNTPTNTAVPPPPTLTNTPIVVTATAPAATNTTVPALTNTPSITLTPSPSDLIISKVDTPDPVNAGQNVTYTITVSNIGGSPANAVTVEDNLPAGLSFQSAQGAPGTNFACFETATPGTVSCTGGVIAAGGSAVITVVARADNPCNVVSPVINRARVDPSNTIAESNETNNEATQATTILGCTQATGTATQTATRTATPTITLTGVPATVTSTPGVDLTIGKVDAPDPVLPGNPLTYSITVQNIGSIAASNVTMFDELDPNVIFSTVSGGAEGGFNCLYNAVFHRVDCTGGNLGPGGGATITVVVDPGNPCNANFFSNRARVDPGGVIAEFNETNNEAFSQTACGAGANTATPLTITATLTPTRTLTLTPTIVPTASFGFLKLDAPDPVVFGGSITYTLRLTNTSGSSISGINIQDVLPPEVTFQSVTALSGGFTCSDIDPGVGTTIQCSNGTVAANSSVDITIVVAVTTCISPIVNTATIITPAVANNSATAVTTVQSCNTVTPTPTSTSTFTATPVFTATATITATPATDLTIAKGTTGFAGTTGDTFTYDVTVTNSGPGSAVWAANQISMRDTLPTGVTFIGSTAVGGVGNTYGATCTFVAGPPARVECSGGTLGNGGVGTVTISVRIDGCGTLTNIAEVDPNNVINETNEGNNLVATNDAATCDTLIVKTQSADALNTSVSAQNVTYTLTLTDVGGTRVAPSTVTDTLPAGFVFQSATVSAGDNGSCSAVGQVVTCTGVSGAEPVTITIVAQVPTSVVLGDYTNNASVVTPGDTNGANDTSSTIVTVYPFDLVVNVTDNQDPVTNIGGVDYSYTVNVTNVSAGGHSAPGVFVAGGLRMRDAAGQPAGAAGAHNAFVDVVPPLVTSQGSCSFPAPGFGGANPDRYACNVGTITAGSNVTVTVPIDRTAAEPDGFPEVSLDGQVSISEPPLCFGGGTDNACAVESNGASFTNAPPASMLANNRDVEFTDID